MRALVPTVLATLGAMLITAFGPSWNARSVLAPMLAQNGLIVVNTEVVLAVDVSASMTPDEQALQREGYVQALSSREFMQALKGAATGASPSPISSGPMLAIKRSSYRGG
jgi:hypothetical protein